MNCIAAILAVARVCLGEQQLEVWWEEPLLEGGGSAELAGGAGGRTGGANSEKARPVSEPADFESLATACRSSLTQSSLAPLSPPSILAPTVPPSITTPQGPPSSLAISCPSSSLAAPCPPHSLGQRAHITLGCAEGVRPVQTGLDQVRKDLCTKAMR